MMKPSTFGFLVVRGVRNLGKHWAMTIACIASPERLYDPEHLCHAGGSQCEQHGELSGPAERNGGLCGPRSRRCHHPVGRERITATPGVSRVQYMSKEDVLNQYRGYMADYAVLLDEFENDNPFKANYRVSLADLSQMQAMSQNFQSIPGVYSVTAPH